jgi:hypothetical protein
MGKPWETHGFEPLEAQKEELELQKTMEELKRKAPRAA